MGLNWLLFFLKLEIQFLIRLQGLYYAGLFLVHTGKYDKAWEYVDRMLKMNPTREVRRETHIEQRTMFLAHVTAQTHRKSSSRSFDPGRGSSKGVIMRSLVKVNRDATLIVGIVLLRLWPWRHNTNPIFSATSKLRLAFISVALHSWTSSFEHTYSLHNLDMRDIVKYCIKMLFCNIRC